MNNDAPDQGENPHHALNARPRAFSVIEWLLYCYAVGSLLKKSWGAVVAGGIPGADKISIGIVVIFVSLVLARNYMVMHSIDNRDRHPVRELQFLDYNLRLEDLAERALRFLIVLAVIISPKQWLGGVAEAIGRIVDHAYTATLAPMGTYTGGDMDEAAYFLLSYYGGVLFLLFGLFVLWDLAGMWAVGRGVRRHNASAASGAAEDLPAVVSAIDYMNSPRSGALRPWALRRVRAGNLVLPYLLSAKARERAAGLVFSVVMMVSALAGMSSLSAFALGAVAIVYYWAANRNGHYIRGLGDFLCFPFRYLFTLRGWSGGQPLLRSADGA